MELEKITNELAKDISKSFNEDVFVLTTEVEKISKILIDFAKAIKKETKEEMVEYFKTYGIPPRY